MQRLLGFVLLLLFNVVNVIETRPAPLPGPPTSQWGKHHHYVLVHEAINAAWYWHKIVALLRSSGNKVTALDMTASGINLKNYTDVHSISDYMKPLTDYMTSLPSKEKVIIVGHAFSGIPVSYMMEHFSEKIFVAVFIGALMPAPYYTAATVYKEAREAEARAKSPLDNVIEQVNGAKVITFGPQYLKTYIYRFAPIEEYELGLMLVRPQHVYSPEDIENVVKLTPERFGTVRRVFIIPEGDWGVPTGFQLLNIERNPPDEVLRINGAGHVLMLTKPIELAHALQRIAAWYSALLSPKIPSTENGNHDVSVI